MKNLFEEKPRWPGAPKICLATNLPALETLSALKKFNEDNGPSCPVFFTFQCKACNHFHSDTGAGAPAGGSSGTGRNSKLDAGDMRARKERWKKFSK